MRLTLREALTLAEPLRQAKVVAGARGLDNVVRSVNVMEVPDILDWVHPGELLVSTLYPLHDDKAAIESLIPSLVEKGLAGLAVTPESYIGRLPSCMLEDAERLGFPLIELPPKVSFVDIIQPLTSKILDLQADELQQSDTILRRFLDLVLIGGDYSDIAQVISEVSGHPVSIVDRFRRILGQGGNVRESMALEFMDEDRTGESYLGTEYEPVSLADQVEQSPQHMVVEVGGKELYSLVYPVEVSSTQLGSIIVWEHASSEVDARALMAIQHGATVVALKMMETRSIGQVEQQFRNEILEGLLAEQAASQASALQLSESLGHRLDPPFAILLVGSDVPSHRLLAPRERREQSNVDTSLHLAQRYIRSYKDGLSFWRRGPHLVVFWPLGPRELHEKARESIASMLRTVCQRIEAENAPYTVSSGISRSVESISDFRQAYEEAKQSFEIGRALAGGKSSAVTHYDDLGLLRFAQVSETSVGIRNYCMDMLGPLLEHDRHSTAQLLDTLRVFLECNQNHAEAARVLGIHYNSLRYRLKRIRQLIGNIFEEPQKRLAIEVALHLHPLLDEGPPSEESPATAH